MTKILLALGLLGAAVVTHAEEMIPTILATQAEREVSYCRTETKPYGDCYAPKVPVAEFRFPRGIAKVISQVAEESLRRGYTGEISLQDLFHGHFVVGGAEKTYPNAQAFLDDIQIMLFHSAEYTGRWRKEAARGLSAERRTPRSFVAWPNGVVQPATDVVTRNVKLKSYEAAGTIYAEEIVRSYPELSTLTYTDFGGLKDKLQIRLPSGEYCQPGVQFFIMNDNKVQPGKLDIFFRCVLVQ